MFPTDQVLLGTSVSHAAGTGAVTLNDAGTYEVLYTSDAAAANGTTPPVVASLQLNSNGTQVPGSLSTATAETAEQTVPLSNSALITVTGATTLELVANNTDATFSNASLMVRRIS
ncbi:hypothetical protein [Pseudoflavonifractor sp. MSJ-37]|uniref:BclA C-terminal domain-containing protein n=1 Tax=Pseudoflavonifractor sp. MSJ-37 TaxID=2841531 RepID=UPI001C102B30|nr:hypothetical protein [Pseudoflavonifractor sp. MSJ-37]